MGESVKLYYASSIQDALSHLTRFPYQLIVVQAGIYKEKTHQLIQTMRKISQIPILVIMLEDEDKSIFYVESGADIAVKVSSCREDILANIYALIRRYLSWVENNNNTQDIIQIEPLLINQISRKMLWDNYEVSLSKHEFDFLYLLVTAPGRVYTFEQIYETVWHEHPHGNINNIVWCMVRRLRKKLRKKDSRAGDIIRSVCNVGYYFEPIKDENT
ncbi:MULTISPECIES: response regulator transcription factor [Clostridia]|uniref:response regulator transcription factor n=1 Tax=Clostridia TaxID=186801 RepID=UPI001652933C|nr:MULTISPECIES: winged helix-turn-helix domain-containing protein [Clostridia]